MLQEVVAEACLTNQRLKVEKMLAQARNEGFVRQSHNDSPALEQENGSSDPAVPRNVNLTCLPSVLHAASGRVACIPPAAAASSCLENNTEYDDEADRMEED